MSAYLHYTLQLCQGTSLYERFVCCAGIQDTDGHRSALGQLFIPPSPKNAVPIVQARATRYMSHLLQAATVSSTPRAIPRELAVVVCSYANIPQSYSIWLGVTDKPTQHSFSATTRPSSAYSFKLYNCLWPSTWDGWETLSHCGHRTSVNLLEPSMDSYVRSIYQFTNCF